MTEAGNSWNKTLEEWYCWFKDRTKILPYPPPKHVGNSLNWQETFMGTVQHLQRGKTELWGWKGKTYDNLPTWGFAIIYLTPYTDLLGTKLHKPVRFSSTTGKITIYFPDGCQNKVTKGQIIQAFEELELLHFT